MAVLALACGATAQAPAGEAAAVGAAPPDAATVAPEVYDELNSHFNLRRPAVARCYSEAVKAGTLARKAKGRVTVELTISPEGSPRDVRVTETTLGSDALSQCVVAVVSAWRLPAPNATTQFSFSYDFEPE